VPRRGSRREQQVALASVMGCKSYANKARIRKKKTMGNVFWNEGSMQKVRHFGEKKLKIA